MSNTCRRITPTGRSSPVSETPQPLQAPGPGTTTPPRGGGGDGNPRPRTPPPRPSPPGRGPPAAAAGAGLVDHHLIRPLDLPQRAASRPGCPPGLRPDRPRSDFGAGLSSPSL